MTNAKLSFVTFDSADVIQTSGLPDALFYTGNPANYFGASGKTERMSGYTSYTGLPTVTGGKYTEILGYTEVGGVVDFTLGETLDSIDFEAYGPNSNFIVFSGMSGTPLGEILEWLDTFGTAN